jgi:hypothetical protein
VGGQRTGEIPGTGRLERILVNEKLEELRRESLLVRSGCASATCARVLTSSSTSWSTTRTEASCESSRPQPDKSRRHIRRDRPAEKPCNRSSRLQARRVTGLTRLLTNVRRLGMGVSRMHARLVDASAYRGCRGGWLDPPSRAAREGAGGGEHVRHAVIPLVTRVLEQTGTVRPRLQVERGSPGRGPRRRIDEGDPVLDGVPARCV